MKRVDFFNSLPVRLAGTILLLSGVTLLALTELNRRAVERILLGQAEVQAAVSTSSVVDALDAVIGSVERLTRFVARDLEGRTLTAAELEKVARDAVLDSPNVYGFTVALGPVEGGAAAAPGRQGVHVHRSNVVNRFVTLDLASPEQAFWTRDWYREALDREQLVWSEPFFDRGGTDRNVVRVTMPVFREAGDERTPVGAVSAVIELDWLRRLANVSEFSETSSTIIFSRTGRLIIHPKPNYVIAETLVTLAEKTGVPELATIQQNVLARRQGFLSYTESLPTRRVHANYRPSKVAGWGVIVAFDEAEFLQGQRQFRRITATFLGSLLVILAGVVIVTTRLALRPLGQLAGAADEIARQNLDCAIAPARRDDEVGRLTESFRSMRDALKAQHLERRWSGQALEHQLRYNQLIIDSVSELVLVLTKGLRISRVNPALLRATGLAETAVVGLPLGQFVRLDAGSGPGLEGLAAALKEGREQHDLAVTIGASPVAATLSLFPLRDAGRVVGGVAILRLKRP